MSNEIALGKDRGLWVAKETTFNSPATLTSAHFLPTVGDAKFGQKPQFEESDEAAMSFSRLGRDMTGYNPGEFSFEFKERASGSLGVAPVGGVVLASLVGKEVISAGASVKYVPRAVSDPNVTFTVLQKKGFDTLLFTGCATVKGTKKVSVQPGKDAVAKVSVSGIFMRRYRAGTDALLSAIDGTTTPVTVIPLKTAGAWKRYDPGARVVIGTDTASGLGHVIASRDSVNNTITLSGTGVTTEQAIDAVVKGWTPAAALSGYTMMNKFGITQINKAGGDYANLAITEATVDIDNGNHALFEKDDTLFPTAIAGGDRVIKFSFTRYVRLDCSDYQYDSENQVAVGVKLPTGNVAGKRSIISLPKIELDDPEESGDLERTVVIPADALATSALDDEIEWLFN